jgi:phosphoserine phosphatase
MDSPTPNIMKNLIIRTISILLLSVSTAHAADPLPSWRNGSAKQLIIGFIHKTTQPGSPDFVPIEDRIAVFDNDGTLWSEQPNYVQLTFAIDRVKELAPKHPEWRVTQPFQAVLEGDLQTLRQQGEHGLLKLITATHAGMSTTDYSTIVSDWLSKAVHPTHKRPYTEMVYLPMLEVLSYFKKHGFKNYIVSGGGVEFMRPWTERVYGIPPEQVIGSSIKTKLVSHNGILELIRLPEINFIDDKADKPVAIHQFIGRRPIAAFGNSDGDLEMLQWVTAGSGTRLGVIIHHTDNEREVAYDRKSPVGRLDKALNQAAIQNWLVVSMKSDWAQIFRQ